MCYCKKEQVLAFTEGAVRFKYSLDTDVTRRLSEGDCKHRDKVLPRVAAVSVNCIMGPGNTAEEWQEKKKTINSD